jgi:hypothetical protein
MLLKVKSKEGVLAMHRDEWIEKANDLGNAYIAAKSHRMPYKQFPFPGADGAHQRYPWSLCCLQVR